MRQAEKFGRPVVCLVDTSGAYPGMEAEERGQGAAIADDIMAMSGLRVPEVSVIMGEGGSGGAIALATAERVLMLSDAVYSVVSPEACASILWKTPKRAGEAAEALGITAPTLERLGIVDGEIDAAGLGTPEFAARLAARLREELAALEGKDGDYDTLFRNGKILGTEAVFQSAWAKAFRRLLEGGSDVLCITMSSRLSGTYRSAKEARAQLMAEGFDGERIALLDSWTTSGGLVFLVQRARRLIVGGATLEETVSELEGATAVRLSRCTWAWAP
jgi:hypothetical protein